MNPYQIIIRPVITEKSTILSEEGKYVFEVDPRANKVMVKEAVEKIFNVKVVDVNITKLPGKPKRYGPRVVVTKPKKKAVVTLRPGDRIQVIEGV